MLLTANEAAALKNPDRIKRWSLKFHYRTQSKTVFDETYTGTSLTKDGPKKSNTIVGAPVLLVNDLKDTAGMVVNYTMLNPLFNDSQSRLNYVKVKGERREGSEKHLSKLFIKFPVAEGFWGVKEEDVNPGKKDIGMFDLMSRMSKALSDNSIQYQDDDCIEGGFLMGHSRHLYTTVAKAANAVDGSAVEAIEASIKDYPIPALPAEHPNTLVWTGGRLVNTAQEAGANFVTKINSVLSKITTADKPGLKLLNAIALQIKVRKMVGIRYIGKGFNRTMFMVLVDPILMTQLREEFNVDGSGLGNVLGHAYQAKGDEHPLVQQGDLVWGQLLIREEERLLESAFSNRYSFDARAQYGDAGTRMTFARVNTGDSIDYFINKAERVVDISSKPAESVFTGTSTATSEQLDSLANILVLGGNAIARVPGPITPLIIRTDDDYQRILGLGTTNIFGHKRLDFVNATGTTEVNQSSIRVIAWRGV